MAFSFKATLQKVFNDFGYQIRKIETGVSFTDSYQEQKRLLQHSTVQTIFEVGAADGRDCIFKRSN